MFYQPTFRFDSVNAVASGTNASTAWRFAYNTGAVTLRRFALRVRRLQRGFVCIACIIAHGVLVSDS